MQGESYMKFQNIVRGAALAAAFTLGGTVAAQPQVLATIGKYQVTANHLDQAIASSPFASRFIAMEANQQAALRGDMLKRLVASRLLTLEAERLGLDEEPAFAKELNDFRRGELYQAYWNRVREEIHLSEAELADLKDRLKGETDALAAARSERLSKRYRLAKLEKLRELRKQFDVINYSRRLAEDPQAETVLAEGRGFEVLYSELGEIAEDAKLARIEEAFYSRLELELVAQAAEESGIDVSEAIAQFRQEQLPARLLQRKAKEWIPGREEARAYFEAHPDIGYVPEVRHVGQIVVEDEALADRLQKRIENGESLFELAKEYSTDPYGKQHAGNMGWLKEGSGMPAIEAALAALPDNTVSEPVQTQKGWHLVVIIDRRKARQMAFEQVEDRVQQAMYNEHISPFLKALGQRYQVAWNLTEAPAR